MENLTARQKFIQKVGGEQKYQEPKKKWIGTVLCGKCNKKGRAYILFRNHSPPYLNVMHFKWIKKKKMYDYGCYLGRCDELGTLEVHNR